MNPKMGVFSNSWQILSCKRMNCNEMDGDRPKLSANRNCYRFSRVSDFLFIAVRQQSIVYANKSAKQTTLRNSSKCVSP